MRRGRLRKSEATCSHQLLCGSGFYLNANVNVNSSTDHMPVGLTALNNLVDHLETHLIRQLTEPPPTCAWARWSSATAFET